jgi:hypothetical protein
VRRLEAETGQFDMAQVKQLVGAGAMPLKRWLAKVDSCASKPGTTARSCGRCLARRHAHRLSFCRNLTTYCG